MIVINIPAQKYYLLQRTASHESVPRVDLYLAQHRSASRINLEHFMMSIEAFTVLAKHQCVEIFSYQGARSSTRTYEGALFLRRLLPSITLISQLYFCVLSSPCWLRSPGAIPRIELAKQQTTRSSSIIVQILENILSRFSKRTPAQLSHYFPPVRL